ncbi:hypothetical protein ACFPYI_21830 [Halomarina salina]|uniref:Uncharacterized protein n=1 Tax=Halomarina salina TaxID=1872699 RepID=A0ABD5RV90_9EURY|nr:hypothetical protein [Halomarina salina]
MSTNLEAVINPLIAGCDEGFIPDELHVTKNPGVSEQFDDITAMMERVVIEYGGDAPELFVTQLEEETDFHGIVDHFRAPIARVQEEGGTTAVDVTPGRKFMSAIAFQAGIQFEADHVYYLYVSNNQFYGRLYPDVPRPVAEFFDFQEVF